MKIYPAIPPPSVPFADFKWRWAANTPTESLNRPDIFLGVLRALAAHEGQAPSSQALQSDLRRIGLQVDSPVDLARSPERNLIRNSGQYWKATGTLLGSQPIQLSPLGRAYAEGAITREEFALHVVQNMELPNRAIYSNVEYNQWRSSGIRVKPLLLILRVLLSLDVLEGSYESYLSPLELQRIVQPMTAETGDAVLIAKAILASRSGSIDIATWSGSVERANDRRMIREFLTWLEYYGFLHKRVVDDGVGGQEQQYFLSSAELSEIALAEARLGFQGVGGTGGSVVDPMAAVLERNRVLREVMDRPGQGRFRREVLLKSQSTCLVTGTRLDAVLQAAHVKPVSLNGSDGTENGLCLRADIHILFDSSRLRIAPDGSLHLVESVRSDAAYSGLPSKVTFPEYISAALLEWRWNYM